jgi:hypothetical protein
MAVFGEGRSLAAETEPLGLLTEGAAGIAVIVLAIIGLAKIQPDILAAIATIVIGVGLLVQGFNTAAEYSRVVTQSPTAGQAAASVQRMDIGGDVMVSFAAGITGIVLGILGLLGIHTQYLIAAAVIVFGAAMLLVGALSLGRSPAAFASQTATQTLAHPAGSAGASGIEIIVGVAAIILGILAIMMTATAGVLTLVALLALGAAMLVVSASFSEAVMRLFTVTA